MGHHSIKEAGSRLSELIDLAARGEAVVLTRQGEPVAEIRPFRKPPGPLTDEQLKWLEEASVEPHRKGETSAEAVRALRDEWDR